MKKMVVFLVMLSLVSALFLGCTGPVAQSGTPEEIASVPYGTSEAGTPTPDTARTSDSGVNTETSDTGFGAIEVRVTDAPKYGIESVLVHFSEVEVHKAAEDPEGEGEWISLIVEDGSFDLVELGKEELEALLAEDDYVPAGKYTQLRVVIDEPVLVTYTEIVETEEGEETVETDEVEAKLPSGELKFVHPFEVVDSTTTIICLDFIVEDSVIFTGATRQNPDTQAYEPKVIVKPVVKLSIEHESLVGTIAGTVTDSETSDPVIGATVAVEGTGLSAETGENGEYEIAGVPVGTGEAIYTVSATAEGYEEATQEDIEVSVDTVTTVDFVLDPGVEP